MTDDAEQLLAAGRGLYYTGKFAEAEQTLQKAVALDAGRADAWFILAMTFRSLGRRSQAIDTCREAVRLDASHAAAHNLLGILLAETGQSAEAIGELQLALALRPDNADSHFNLGLILLREQRVAEAVEAWRSTIKLRPAHAGAQAMLRQYAPAAPPTPLALGTTESLVGANVTAAQTGRERLMQLKRQLDVANDAFERGDLAAAEAVCREAIRTSSGDPRAIGNLGMVLVRQGRNAEAARELQIAVARAPGDANNRYAFGCALSELQKHDEAIGHYQEAIRLRPAFVLAHVELGNSLAATHRYQEAEVHLRRALELDANCLEAHHALSNLLITERRYAEAESASRRAVELKPDYAAAWNNVGRALARQLRYAEADQCYERVLQLDPHSPQTRYNRAFARLVQGRWLEAWPDYEYRFFTPELMGRNVTQRPWRGEPLEGRTILLYADQALGDTLQAVRYVPLVAARGGRVLLSVQRPLLSLLARLPGVEQLLDRSQPPSHFDVQAALMSLPGLFGTTPDNAPANVPYLSADPELVVYWRDELPRKGSREGTAHRGQGTGDSAQRAENPKSKIQNPKSVLVGIAWHGNPDFRAGLHRSIPLTAFEPFARLRGIQLISLQKGPGSEQVAQVPFAERIVDLSSSLDEESGPFMDTAAIMTQLDLVISCDTALAHLAGALAVPVWVALPAVAEWRWLLDRDDTPWYPTMRLFRQREPGNWSEVFQRIADALQKEFPLPPGEAR